MAKSFRDAIQGPDPSINLPEASLWIAGDEYPRLDVPAYLGQIDDWSRSYRRFLQHGGHSVQRTDRWKLLGFLNELFFEDLGFRSNQTDYYQPGNSYLNVVMDQRTGIPITLSVLYLEIGRRAGLPLEGVGLPGHFMLGWYGEQNTLLIDVFGGGAILSVPECQERVDRIHGVHVPLKREWLEPVSNRYILRRILGNLKSAWLRSGSTDRVIATVEKIVELDPEDEQELRDLGALYAEAGQLWAALTRLEKYLAIAPDAPDAPAVRELTATLFAQLSN